MQVWSSCIMLKPPDLGANFTINFKHWFFNFPIPAVVGLFILRQKTII